MATPGFKAPDKAGRWLRNTLRRRVGQLIGGGTLADAIGDPLAPAALQRILVCRLNVRLGNTLLLTALLGELHRVLPHAVIDLAVCYPRAQALLGGLPGLGRIHVVPHKPILAPRAFMAAVRTLRAQSYDLAIDPVPNSTGGRIALASARAGYTLGFASSEQWLRLTHAVPLPDDVPHEALRPLRLLQAIRGYGPDPSAPPRLRVPCGDAELAKGRQLVQDAVAARSGGGEGRRLVGFFASARGAKDLGSDWWRSFWQAFLTLEPDVLPVEFLPFEGHVPVDAHGVHLTLGSPRDMTAAMAAMRFFVSSDTGPMHLASATDVPTVGLFTATDPARYGPIKPVDLSLLAGGRPPQEIAAACSRQMRATT
jgi:ADP-heptose:LPS heptosyltransferase